MFRSVEARFVVSTVKQSTYSVYIVWSIIATVPWQCAMESALINKTVADLGTERSMFRTVEAHFVVSKQSAHSMQLMVGLL